jgi:enamine deaminase RidA (YjgF/YER057c/UK114 family)
VVKVNVFITSMKDFEAMNTGYSKVMPKPLPVSVVLSFYMTRLLVRREGRLRRESVEAVALLTMFAMYSVGLV